MIDRSPSVHPALSPREPEWKLLTPAAYKFLAESDMTPEDRALLAPLAEDSPRMRGAPDKVLELARELRPYAVEALSFLRAYEAENLLPRFGPKDWYRQDFASHVRRHTFTFAMLRHFLHAQARRLGREPRVLDVGGRSILRDALKLDFWVHATEGDLRGPFSRGPERSYDLIICTEVIEHISDPQVGYVGDTVRSFNVEVQHAGARHMLNRLAEVLDPDGLLFLSTPNCLSLHVLRKLAERNPPAIYRPHYREYMPAEIRDLLEDAGLSPLVTTVEFYMTGEDLTPELDFLQKSGRGPLTSLGDTLVAWGVPEPREDSPPYGRPPRPYLEVLVRATAPEGRVERLGLEHLANDVLVAKPEPVEP